MFPRKKTKKPPDFKYPHKFKVGDLVKPKYPIQNYHIQDELAVILKLHKVEGQDMVEILLQSTGSVVVMMLPRLLLHYEKA
jgi:hypothetical protein